MGGGGDLDREPETRTVAAHLEPPLLADGGLRGGPERGAVGLEGDGLELRELRRPAARVLGLVELARLGIRGETGVGMLRVAIEINEPLNSQFTIVGRRDHLCTSSGPEEQNLELA